MAYEKLRDTPCWTDIRSKMEAGIAAEKVAAWAMESECYGDSMKTATLVRTLYRWKKSELPVTPEEFEASRSAEDDRPRVKVWERVEKMRRGLDELEELEKLYRLQQRRVEMGMQVEERINFPNKEVRRDVETAATILRRMVDLKLRTGVYKEAPSELHLSGHFTKEVTERVKKMAPAKRKALSAVARSLLSELTAPDRDEKATAQAAETVIEEPEFEGE